MKLLLVWITLPLLLFSVAQTKLGWYISMIYPAIALLLGLALVDLFTERWALGVVAVVMCVCCLRLPSTRRRLPRCQAVCPASGAVGHPWRAHLCVSRGLYSPHTGVYLQRTAH